MAQTIRHLIEMLSFSAIYPRLLAPYVSLALNLANIVCPHCHYFNLICFPFNLDVFTNYPQLVALSFMFSHIALTVVAISLCFKQIFKFQISIQYV